MVYPRSGWRRALGYVARRILRLPDSPHRIALGFACGIFVCFLPFFGLHVILACILALVLRGNVLAALIGTFFGNPVTFPVIATISFQVGQELLGMDHDEAAIVTVLGALREAADTMKHNLVSLLGSETASWDGMTELAVTVILPYLAGGMLPGLLSALMAYLVSKPLIRAYQVRRKKRRKAMKNERPASGAPEQGPSPLATGPSATGATTATAAAAATVAGPTARKAGSIASEMPVATSDPGQRGGP